MSRLNPAAGHRWPRIHWRFVGRQLLDSRPQLLAFILCVALSMLTLVALAGFRQSVEAALRHDARQLLAGDIAVTSSADFAPPLVQLLARLGAQGRVEQARLYEFYSVVRDRGNANSLLAKIKIVAPRYPFYGAVALASGRPLAEVLTAGRVVVEETLLDRLGLRLGDPLQVGNLTLVIADLVRDEPDRPASLFSLGPRVFVAAADLEGLGLVEAASRVEHKILLRIAEERELAAVVAELKQAANPDQEVVATALTAESGGRRFFDNFLFFLALIGIFTLLLAGMGIQSALTALLREKENTIAVIMAMGGSGFWVQSHFLLVVAVLGGVGILVGLLGSFLLQAGLPFLFAGLLPLSLTFTVAWPAVGQGILLGGVSVGLFSFYPFYRLRGLKPRAILHRELLPSRRGRPYYLVSLAMVAMIAVLLLWQLQEYELGAYFLGGLAALLLVILLATKFLLWGARRLPCRSLAWRLAVRGLFRPHNATQAIVLTLTAALAVIFSLYLIERNLDAAFVQAYPADAPNLIFLDIQPGQQEEFARLLGRPALYYPAVRARVKEIKGEKIDRRQELRQRRDNFAREFSLTYRDFLLADETLIRGKSLFRPDWQGAQVSLLDTVVGMKAVTIGDTIDFSIQGVPIQARVSSIRSRGKSTLAPFFYYVLQPEVLRSAPQTIFTALRVAPSELGALQNRMVASFPNVSVIDLGETAAVFGRILHKLATIIRFFTMFSIASGMLILLGAILASRLARIREAVYYKLLGARGGFVLLVFALEHLLLALASGGMALAIAEAASYTICVHRLGLGYHPCWGAGLLMVAAAALVVVAIGLLASRSIICQRPAAFLLGQNEE